MKRPPACDRPDCGNDVTDPGGPEGKDRLGVTVRGGAKALAGVPATDRTIRHVHLDLCEPCRAELHAWWEGPAR